MNIDRIDNIEPSFPNAVVTVKETGNVIEIRYMQFSAYDCPIKKLSSDLYVEKSTGEIKQFKHTLSRINDKSSVAQSLKKLRDIINSNIINPNKVLWVTLTYKQNMTNPSQLYEDYRRFWLRFKYYLQKHNYPKAEYIIAAEPQGRGAWHLHCLFLFNKRPPFISNDKIAHIWGNGFTKTKGLKGIDNPGLYLTAYLGNMELGDALNNGITKGRLSEANVEDAQGILRKKAIVKGARLSLYPTGFNLYRCSRGIKRPVIYKTTEATAQRITEHAQKIYEKTISIADEEGKIKNIINYRQYKKQQRSDCLY